MASGFRGYGCSRALVSLAAADASVVVAGGASAPTLAVGVLQSDAQHGNRGNGALHSLADASNAGFLSAADFTKLASVASLGATAGAPVTLSAASAGVLTTAAKSDHTHQLDVSISPAWTGQHSITNAAVPLTATITDGAAATQLEGLRVEHDSSVNGTAGNGVFINLRGTNGASTPADAARVLGFLRTVTAGAETGALVFQVNNSGTMTNQGFATSATLYGTSLGIGTIGATGTISTSATLAASGSFIVVNAAVNSLGGFNFTGTANNTAARAFFKLSPPSNTASTAGTEINFGSWDAHTHQWASNTALSNQREWSIAAPTYAFATSGGVISDAATWYISGAPIAGTNATITRGYSLWTGGGQHRMDGIAITAAGGGATATNGTIGGSGPTTAAAAKWVPITLDGTQHWFQVWL